MSMDEWLRRKEVEAVAGRQVAPKASKYHREIKPGVMVEVRPA